jgi:hypothetical protein
LWERTEHRKIEAIEAIKEDPGDNRPRIARERFTTQIVHVIAEKDRPPICVPIDMEGPWR